MIVLHLSIQKLVVLMKVNLKKDGLLIIIENLMTKFLKVLTNIMVKWLAWVSSIIYNHRFALKLSLV